MIWLPKLKAVAAYLEKREAEAAETRSKLEKSCKRQGECKAACIPFVPTADERKKKDKNRRPGLCGEVLKIHMGVDEYRKFQQQKSPQEQSPLQHMPHQQTPALQNPPQ